MTHRTWSDHQSSLSDCEVPPNPEIYPPSLPESDYESFGEGYESGFECHICLELSELQDPAFIDGFLQGLRDSMQSRRTELEDKLYGSIQEPENLSHLQYTEF